MISPAAVKTNMLQEGFKDDLNSIEELQQYHPTNSIGNPNGPTLLVSIFKII